MQALRMVVVVAVVVLAGCPSKSPPSTGPTPTGPEEVPGSGSDSSGTGLGSAIFATDLDCKVPKQRDMCNQAHESSIAVAVHRVKDCNISTASKELTISMESTPPGSTVRVRIPNFTSATSTYEIDEVNAIALSGSGSEASNGAIPDNLGTTCEKKCTVAVAEDTVQSPRHLKLEVQCKELCVANACLKCTTKGKPAVQFNLDIPCP